MRGSHLPICGDAGRPAGAQLLLAPLHLAGQRVAHPFHQRRLLSEVGDDRTDMPGLLEAEKGCTAFEVDQHQIQVLR